MTNWNLEVICPGCGNRMLVALNDKGVFELPTRCPECYYPEPESQQADTREKKE